MHEAEAAAGEESGEESVFTEEDEGRLLEWAWTIYD